MITESNQNIESSRDSLTDVQPKDIHENYFEKKDKSSSSKKNEIFQVDLETIRSETTTDGEFNGFFSFDNYI